MEVATNLEDDERAIELSSIAAIFPEIVLDPTKPFDAQLSLQVAPVAPLKVQFSVLADGAPPALLPTPPTSDTDLRKTTATKRSEDVVNEVTDETYNLTYLPPVLVRIHLPDGYPSEKPPIFQVSTLPIWIPKRKLEDLTAAGVRLWEELGHDQVVFSYIDHIQQSAENAFGLADPDKGLLHLSRDLKISLLDHDMKAKQEKFEQGTFECGICLEPKKGKSCHRLIGCGHVFCVQCLRECYNNSISEGDVDRVRCLEPSCAKGTNALSTPRRKRKDITLNPSELLQIPLEQDIVQRYVHLKRKKRLESDQSTVYCPRQWCQGAARSKKHPKPVDPMADEFEDVLDPEDQPVDRKEVKKKPKEDEYPPMADRLCICEDCSYAFCSVCKKGWHGELSVCNPRKEAELRAEEKATAEYLMLHTTPCPTCAAPCQKTMGCNHMICFKCKTHFCYLCSSFLMEDNPYQHFNDHKSTCYMRLWELEGGDGAQVDHRFHGGVEEWLDEESDDELNIAAETDADDDVSVHSGDTDDLPDGPNWVLDPDQAFPVDDDDSESEGDVWVPGPAFNRHQVAAAAGNQPPQIQIINFAQAGVRNPFHEPARNQQNNFADLPIQAPPPPRAPNPPRRRNRDRRPQHPPVAAAHDDLAAEILAEENQRMERLNAAPGQRHDAALQPAPVRAMGLERFLEMARNDMEDEWDSDELDEAFDDRYDDGHGERGRLPRGGW